MSFSLISRFSFSFALVLGEFLLTATDSFGQITQRFDVRMRMRDGVELSADIWMPAKPGKHPTILVRTPYLKTRHGSWGPEYAKRGFAVVIQDTRGRGDSDGQFDFFTTDTKDGYDSVEWVAAQPWSS